MSNFQLRVGSNPGFCFTLLCDWSRKLAPLSQPIRCKTKASQDWVNRVFPRSIPLLNRESKLIRDCFGFLYFVLRLIKKIRATSSNSQIKIKSNRDLVNGFFPRFKQFSYSTLSSHWLLVTIYLLWLTQSYWHYEGKSKSDLSCVSIFWDDRAMLIW